MSLKILTVDDSKTIRLIVARAFRKYDVEIHEATNGVEGLAAAARENPDLILLDYTMPLMDGLEMLGRLKLDPGLKHIPVIMLTAESGRENVLKIAKLGVRDYLIKPFKEDIVVERVGRLLALSFKEGHPPRSKSGNEPMTMFIVDDKPAIIEQIRAGYVGSTWSITGIADFAHAFDAIAESRPDIVLVSLSLADGAAFSLFQMIRANSDTKDIPVFGLSVRTAVEDQLRAQQLGFAGVITKPIDFEDLTLKTTRALNLDTAAKYFCDRDETLLLQVPEPCSPTVLNELSLQLRPKICNAVDSGLMRMVIDLSAVRALDLNLIKLGISASQTCHELGIRLCIVGSGSLQTECTKFEETQEWLIAGSFQDAVSLLSQPSAVPLT